LLSPLLWFWSLVAVVTAAWLASLPRVMYARLDVAANDGIAVRKASLRWPQIGAPMLMLWKRLSPGRSMDAYRVRSASWTGQRYTLHG
jgi:hypothetical protein